jgi:nucleotide-binding universal stress UspA family protein
MYKHLLIATDGSDLARCAMREGIGLAHALGARVTAMTVTLPFHVFSTNPTMVTDTEASYRVDMSRQAEGFLAPIKQEATTQGVPVETVHRVHEHAWEAIVETARSKGCDLVVMASHGRSGVGALLVGSQTAKVIAHSNVPVLVARPPR